MKKILLVILFLLGVFGCCIIFNSNSKDTFSKLVVEDAFVDIDNIYIYGTHLNMEGNIVSSNNLKLVLYDGKDFLPFDINVNDNKFNLSNYINDGIYLDSIPRGEYYVFIRDEDKDSDNNIIYKYYSINNNSKYKEMKYYSMSKYNNKIIISNDDIYSTIKISVAQNTDNNIYDIVIDPGHGGSDYGAVKNGYTEADLTMEIALKTKKKLEEYGFKVKLTREKDELGKNDILNKYGPGGRAVIPHEVNSKYLFSIHLNSTSNTNASGLEIYTAKNINYDLSKIIAKNITSMCGIKYSNNGDNKVFDGVYTRIFSKYDIKESINEANEDNLLPYDIKENSNYYYIIRETGGILTGAYVDNRNDSVLFNPYVSSNIGVESYILELGYISNKKDIDIITKSIDEYAKAIAVSINSLNDL